MNNVYFHWLYFLWMHWSASFIILSRFRLSFTSIKLGILRVFIRNQSFIQNIFHYPFLVKFLSIELACAFIPCVNTAFVQFPYLFISLKHSSKFSASFSFRNCNSAASLDILMRWNKSIRWKVNKFTQFACSLLFRCFLLSF